MDTEESSRTDNKVIVSKETPRLEENLQRRARIRARRATKILTEEDPQLKKLTAKQRKKIRTYVKWWKKESVRYAFANPYVRARLEKLMGSNIVSIVDRQYMQQLQRRIAEEYIEQQDKRIQVRKEEEMTRLRSLVLSGIIPLGEAPAVMADHPVMIIENYCNKIIQERRARIKYGQYKIASKVYIDDSPDLPSGLTIVTGHKFRAETEKLCHPVCRTLTVEDKDDEYMYLPEEYDRLKYESPAIFDLRAIHKVEDLYKLGDELVGYLDHFDRTPYRSRPSEIDKPRSPDPPKTALEGRLAHSPF